MRVAECLLKIGLIMKRATLLFSAVSLLLGTLQTFAQTPATSPAPSPEAPAPLTTPTFKEVAVIKTNKGEITVEFWSDVAPETVKNFKKLSKEGFYKDTAFHRIIKGFMIQGGDPKTKDLSQESAWGTGDPGYKIKAEFNERKHERGVLSMARSNDPDSAGSQFFICLDAAPFLDGKYTAFGHVIKGEDVLLKIGDTPVVSNGRERSKPTERIAVESITIVSPQVPTPPPTAPATPSAAPATTAPAAK